MGGTVIQGNGECAVLSHRGLHGHHPENSLDALEASIRLGADGVEIDLRRTADGVVVLVHDEDVQGVRVADVSHAHLRRLAPWVPTLDEALTAIGGRTFVNLELKEPGYENAVVSAVQQRLPAGSYLFTSFLDRTLRAAATAAGSGTACGLLIGDSSVRHTGRWLGEWVSLARGSLAGAHLLVMHWTLATPRLLRRARRLGRPIIVWTVNDEALLARFMRDPAVVAVITDTPAVALRVRDGGDRVSVRGTTVRHDSARRGSPR